MQLAAVLENGGDVARLAEINWDSIRRLQAIAAERAALTIRELNLSAGQISAIERQLDLGDKASAFRLFQAYTGSEVHKAVAEGWERAGLISTRQMAPRGVDVPMGAVTAPGVPFPLELHPNTTYSFGQHINRPEYPSYLTITYQSAGFDAFATRFGASFRH